MILGAAKSNDRQTRSVTGGDISRCRAGQWGWPDVTGIGGGMAKLGSTGGGRES
jgi:hypothetical protein